MHVFRVTHSVLQTSTYGSRSSASASAETTIWSYCVPTLECMTTSLTTAAVIRAEVAPAAAAGHLLGRGRARWSARRTSPSSPAARLDVLTAIAAP